MALNAFCDKTLHINLKSRKISNEHAVCVHIYNFRLIFKKVSFATCDISQLALDFLRFVSLDTIEKYGTLKVLDKSVGLCKTTKRKDQWYISLFVCVWRIICENFNPN